jgi:hypothetical protein
MGEPSFFIPLAVAGVAYLLAIRELLSTPEFPKRVIVFGLALSALWQVQFLRTPPGLDDDIHRYVWDGRVQRLGYNPYIVVPSDAALASLHTSETRTLNNPEVPISSGGAAILPRRNIDSRVYIRAESSICSLRFGDCVCVARCLALYPAGRALGSGLCLAPTASD